MADPYLSDDEQQSMERRVTVWTGAALETFVSRVGGKGVCELHPGSSIAAWKECQDGHWFRLSNEVTNQLKGYRQVMLDRQRGLITTKEAADLLGTQIIESKDAPNKLVIPALGQSQLGGVIEIRMTPGAISSSQYSGAPSFLSPTDNIHFNMTVKALSSGDPIPQSFFLIRRMDMQIGRWITVYENKRAGASAAASEKGVVFSFDVSSGDQSIFKLGEGEAGYYEAIGYTLTKETMALRQKIGNGETMHTISRSLGAKTLTFVVSSLDVTDPDIAPAMTATKVPRDAQSRFFETNITWGEAKRRARLELGACGIFIYGGRGPYGCWIDYEEYEAVCDNDAERFNPIGEADTITIESVLNSTPIIETQPPIQPPVTQLVTEPVIHPPPIVQEPAVEPPPVVPAVTATAPPPVNPMSVEPPPTQKRKLSTAQLIINLENRINKLLDNPHIYKAKKEVEEKKKYKVHVLPQDIHIPPIFPTGTKSVITNNLLNNFSEDSVSNVTGGGGTGGSSGPSGGGTGGSNEPSGLGSTVAAFFPSLGAGDAGGYSRGDQYIMGCTDTDAVNYDNAADIDNNTCFYKNEQLTATTFNQYPELVEMGEDAFKIYRHKKQSVSSMAPRNGPNWVEEPALDFRLDSAACKEMESEGTLYIGDILFSVPPTSMSFSFQNQSTAIPTMRTYGDPTITTNNEIPRVSLTIYFNGEKAINQQLRPLLSMYQTLPFTTIQNTTIYDSWVPRQLLNTLEEDQKVTTRCQPLPCFLENISFSTIPGFPNSIQANISLVAMNYLPYGTIFKLWRFTKDAYKASIDTAVRHATNTTILDLPRPKTVSTNEDGKSKNIDMDLVLGDSGKIYRLTIEDQENDSKVTMYPQNSWPYKKLYRNRLAEEVSAYKSTSMIDPIRDWPTYKMEDNGFLYMQYTTVKKLDDPVIKFQDRLAKLKHRFGILNAIWEQAMYIPAGTEGYTAKDFFGKFKEIEFSAYLSEMLGYMSLYRTAGEAKTSIKNLIKTLASEANNGPFNLGSFKDDAGNDIRIDGYENIEHFDIIDKDGHVEEPFNWWAANVQKSLSGKNNEKVQKHLAKMLGTIQEHYKQNMNNSLDSTSNFEAVKLRFGWNSSTANKASGDALEVFATSGTLSKTMLEAPAVVQSISYSFANNVAPLFTSSGRIPTYQHMGVPNSNATIILRVRDERLLKIFTDMRDSTHAIGKQVLAGNLLLNDLVACRVDGKADLTGTSGHLLNSIGFKEFTVTAIDSSTIEGFPGWWEVSLDIMSNDQKLRKLERLNLAKSSLSINYLQLMSYIFPTHLLAETNVFQDLGDDYKKLVLEEKEIRKMDETIAEDLYPSIWAYQLFKDAWNSYQQRGAEQKLVEQISLQNSEVPMVKWNSVQRKFDISLQAPYGQKFKDWSAPEGGMYGTSHLSIAIAQDAYAQDTETRNKDVLTRTEKESLYIKLLQPILDHGSQLIINYDLFYSRSLKGSVESQSSFSPVAAFSRYYEDYIANLISTISSIVTNNTHDLLQEDKIKNIFPNYATGGAVSANNLYIQPMVLGQLTSSTFIELIRTSSFRKFMESYKKVLGIPGSIDLEGFYDEFYLSFARSIKPNHPDLRLPDIIMKDTGTRIMSPAFPFVDTDMDVDLIEMEKLVMTSKLEIISQMAALLGQTSYKTFTAYQDKIENSFEAVIKTLTSRKWFKIPSFLEKDGKLSFEKVREGFTEASEMVDKSRNSADLSPDPLTMFTNEGAAGMSQAKIMALMTSVAMTDYVLTIFAVAGQVTGKNYMVVGPGAGAGENLDIVAELLSLMEQSKKDHWDEAGKNKKGNEGGVWGAKGIEDLLRSTLQTLGNKGDLTIQDSERWMRNAELLFDKRERLIKMCSIAALGDWKAFHNFFGTGEPEGKKKNLELLQKIGEYIKHKRRSTLDRAFPTFKIYLIEEDNYVWNAFDDFYTWDAASEITIIESKHAASKTAVLKLSNVTSKLTGQNMANILNEGIEPTVGNNMKIRVGTQVMIFVGYGADQKHLRMKFKGAITELSPGPITEITCQSWGAGLLNNVGTRGSITYSSQSGATTLGAVVIDLLSQTSGLKHLGRWELRKSGLNDPSKVPESSLKNAYWGKMIASFLGTSLGDLSPIQTDTTAGVAELARAFQDVNLPTTQDALVDEYYRANNNVVRSFGNSLYDNIIINDSSPKGYGFFNFLGRLAESTSFTWFIQDQNAWDALQEVALFMGDYIITTLPFNEGSDMMSYQPRETLYFGPREGMYKSSYSSEAGTGLHTADVLKEFLQNGLHKYNQLLQTVNDISKNNPRFEGLTHGSVKFIELVRKIKEETRQEAYEEVINLGLTVIADLIGRAYKQGQGNFSPINISELLERNFFTRLAALLTPLVISSQAELKPAAVTLIKTRLESGGNPSAARLNEMADAKNSFVWQSYDAQTTNSSWSGMWARQVSSYSAGHEVLNSFVTLNYNGDFYNDLRTDRAGSATMSPNDVNFINALIEGRYQNFDALEKSEEWIDFTNQGDEERRLSFGGFLSGYIQRPNLGTLAWLLLMQDYTDSGHRSSRGNNKNNGLAQKQQRIHLLDYFYDHREAVLNDTLSLIDAYLNNKIIGSFGSKVDPRYEGFWEPTREPIFADLDRSVREMKGLDDLFSTKPVVQYHIASSWQDIIDNGIIATADQMYNHVEVLYNADPDPTKNSSTASLRTSAMISYDQDADYLRTYSVYMKNMNPNWWMETSQAELYFKAKDIDPYTQRASMLTPDSVAQTVLMNVMRPMYQGNLTLIGNPHIRPWDIVHIHDDDLGMYGLVEVEQVVTSMSAVTGYTTTIIPNLLVYQKHLVKALDNHVLQAIGSIQNISIWGGAIIDSAIGLGVFAGLKHYGGKMGSWIERGAYKYELGQVENKLAKAKAFKNEKGMSVAFKREAEGIIKTHKKQIEALKAGSKGQTAGQLVRKMSSKGRFLKFAGKLTNVIGYIWLAYDVASIAWDTWAGAARNKIHVASLLSGENQLCWLPLDFQGNDYVAGVEGIIGTPRSINTMVYGELNFEEGEYNRAFYVMDHASIKGTLGMFEDPRTRR